MGGGLNSGRYAYIYENRLYDFMGLQSKKWSVQIGVEWILLKITPPPSVIHA